MNGSGAGMSWRKSLGRLLGTSAKPAARPTAASKSKGGVADSARAAIIAEARRIHRAQSANVRATLVKAIDELQRGGAKNPARSRRLLTRLMELIHAQQTMQELTANDMKRYLLLTGIRESMDKGSRRQSP